MGCAECGLREAQEGRDICFACKIKGVGFTWRGGALLGRRGWNKTHRDHLEEHFGVSSGAELAKTRSDVDRAPS